LGIRGKMVAWKKGQNRAVDLEKDDFFVSIIPLPA
jgi:hypothetical protein